MRSKQKPKISIIPFFRLIIILVIIFVFSLVVILFGNPFNRGGINDIGHRPIFMSSINNKIDIDKAAKIVYKLQELDSNDPPLMSYLHYGMKNNDKISCQDYAISFAILYGTPAQLAYNENHAFVVINGVIVEPNQRGTFNIRDRMNGVDYYIKYRLGNFREEDIILIKNYFENK